jgi:GT2 family glycosyltransferase
MKFVFIAVNYNGSQHTENFLQSLQEMTLPNNDILEAIIVDSKSSDADLAMVKNSISKRSFARLIVQKNNYGYFKGLNAGIKNCSKCDNTLLIVGNNDLKFASDFILHLKGIPYENDVMVIAPNIVTLDGRKQNPHVVSSVAKLELIKSRIYFSNYYVGQASRYIYALFRLVAKNVFLKSKKIEKNAEFGRIKIKRGIGACYVLTPNFFQYYELLDDRVFLWGEEALLSNQVECVGGCTLYDPMIKITHCESASVRFIEKRERYDIVRASYKIYRQYL